MWALKVSTARVNTGGKQGKELGRRAEARFPWAGLQMQLRAKVTGELVRVSGWAAEQFHMMLLCKNCEGCSVLKVQPRTRGTERLSSISE